MELLEKYGFNRAAELQKIHVYQAIVWSVTTWTHVKPNTICCCFQRSTVKFYCSVVEPGRIFSVTSVPLFTSDKPLQIEELDAVKISAMLIELENSVATFQQHSIYNSVDIDEFLNLAVEMVKDSTAYLE